MISIVATKQEWISKENEKLDDFHRDLRFFRDMRKAGIPADFRRYYEETDFAKTTNKTSIRLRPRLSTPSSDKTPSARLLLRLKQNEIARYERRQRPRLNHRTP